MRNLIFAALGAALLLCGCGAAPAGTAGGTITQHESTTQEVQILEDWELALLSGVYGTEAERERLQTGELYDYQEAQLTQLRAVARYLSEKYPGHAFRITDIELRHSTKSSIDYLFTAEGTEALYTAVADGPESTEFRDDYYVTLIGDAYDAALAERLREETPDVVAVETAFSALLGTDVTGTEAPEALLAMGSALPRDTAVYVGGADPEAALERTKAAIESLNIYGAYRLYSSERFHAGMTAADCASLRAAEPSAVQSASVQCFS